ncbi:hypothetical protein [uncultured Psychrosphaera sp.]|uniref:hypothetical protein n=1 Tax=uncultured Psychrosphaera sp. TaxID=1403522 RepID=UPI002634BEC8|nr:hypothetical protein [uncultured Psychrosphaera sp.]
MDPQFSELALMRPTKLHQKVLVQTVTVSCNKYITDILCRLGDDQSIVVKKIALTSETLLPNAILVNIEDQGVFELAVSALSPNLKELLDANVKVRLLFKLDDRKFIVSSFKPQIPNTLDGTFFYDEKRHKMGGKDVTLGSFTSSCGVYKNLPCEMMRATLTKSRVFSELTEGFSLNAKVDCNASEGEESLVVKELTLPTYPNTFEADITNAELREKEKTTDNILVCDFSYFEGLTSRVNIANKKLDVVAVKGIVSFKATLSFKAVGTFKFTFLELAMPSPFNAKVFPKELVPYPSEFEFVCFGLIIKVNVKEDSWEAFKKSKEQISYSGVSLPDFELGKGLTLPVTFWQPKKAPEEHSAWSPKVTFFLNKFSLPETIEGTISYVTSENRDGHLYYLFRFGEEDMHYPILAAEFFLFGIGGFSENASIDVRIEKYRRYNSEKKKSYKAKHLRGSHRNEWSVQEIMSPLPTLSPSESNSYQEAYCVMEWDADVELIKLSNEYWKDFSTQRRNFVYCALTGHGDLYPLVAVPPILLRENDCYKFESGQEIKMKVGNESVSLKKDILQWRWAKSIEVASSSKEPSQSKIKRLTCIKQEEIEPKNSKGENGNKYLRLTFIDSDGAEYIYNSFKLGSYPLEESDFGKYDHLTLCVGKNRIVEIVEMVKKNET